MNYPPTTSDVSELSQAIAADGVVLHRAAIDILAEVADGVGLFPGAVAALTSSDPAAVPFSRAFLVLARNWSDIRATWCANSMFEDALQRLLAQWRQHEDLRQSAEVASLVESRTKLEELRSATADARSASQLGPGTVASLC